MAKFEIEINEAACKGCGICVTVCPSETLEIREKFNQSGYYCPEPVNMEECTGCGACAKLCPDFAVTVYKYKDAS